MTGPTNFTESNALLYVQAGSEDAARESLRTLYGTELDNLSAAAVRLAELIEAERSERQGMSLDQVKRRIEGA